MTARLFGVEDDFFGLLAPLFVEHTWTKGPGKTSEKEDFVAAPLARVGYDEEGVYCISLDLPGVDKKNLSVRVEDRFLVVSGTREEKKFRREIHLPHTPDEVDAKLENGVLKVRLPGNAGSREVEVK